MPNYSSSPPTYQSATQPTTGYNWHPPLNPNAQRRPQHTGSARNHQNRNDTRGPPVPPVFESEEREPLQPTGKQQPATSSSSSFTNKSLILMIVAAFSLYHIGWWALWDATASCQNHRAQWEKELKVEKAQRDRQQDIYREEERLRRLREAQWHMSQEQRERLGLHWDEVIIGSCISHGVRSYRARLLDAASYNYNPIVPCRKMSLDIQGVSTKANYCESKGNETWGHWKIENDPFCTPIFQDWREDGCVAPGSRRRLASARLDFIATKEDGPRLCPSTPIRFKDMYFDRPLSCESTFWGMWGHWEYDDDSC